MLRIYDDRQVRRMGRLRQLQMALLFATGVSCGSWLTTNGGALRAVPAAAAAEHPASAPAAARWCRNGNARSGRLHLDCEMGSLAP